MDSTIGRVKDFSYITRLFDQCSISFEKRRLSDFLRISPGESEYFCLNALQNEEKSTCPTAYPTRSAGVPEVIRRTLKNYYELLNEGRIKLFNWGKYRWLECFVAIRFIKEIYPEDAWVADLARILKEQGTDYESLTELWKEPSNRWSFDTHIVNLCMMLKSEAISCGMLGEEYRGLADRLDSILKKYNGTVTCIYTGDECLSGNSPIQGTELCAVVELMYSCEWLYAVTGDKKWAELLEMQAFNALPATFTDDMWAHQYVQMSNQIDCTPFGGNPIFGTNDQHAHEFGLEPHFGCCTSNFGQGWSKLALSTFMRANDGAVSAIPVASEVKFANKGANITVTLESDYPFKNSFTYRVNCDKKTSARLHIRIPSFAKNITVNGEKTAKRPMLNFGGFSKGETVISLSFDVDVKLITRPNGMFTARRGSLLFSLPVEIESKKVEYTRAGVEIKFPYCDYHFRGISDWNFGFASDKLDVTEEDVCDADNYPFFSNPPPSRSRQSLPISTGNVSHASTESAPRYPLAARLSICLRRSSSILTDAQS